MFASDYRGLARGALRGKWKPTLCVMLLAQAVFLYFGLDILYMNFFAQRLYFEFGGATYGFNNYYACIPQGVVGWLFLAVLLLFDCVSAMVTVGQYRAMAGLYRGEAPAARQLFPWELFGKALLMNIVRALLVFAWSMLFVFPGIVAIYRYSMADYLLAENPELGPVEALRESRARMMGHKWELFCLQLSFFGWALLALFAELILNSLLFDGMSGPGVLSSLVYTLCVCLLSAPLNTYMLAAEVAFFGKLTGRASAPKVDVSGEYVGAKFGGSEDVADAERERCGAEPEAFDEGEQGFPEPGVDESVARDMFRSHGCSRKRLRDEGLWEGYEALRPYPASEAVWRREYADELMRRFDRDPEALGELLDLCAEYADDQLANRVLARIDRHIRQQTLPDEEILNMAGRTLAMLVSGAFTDEGFLARRREQVRDMADRLERRLREADPDGGWQSALQLVREMCGRG